MSPAEDKESTLDEDVIVSGADVTEELLVLQSSWLERKNPERIDPMLELLSFVSIALFLILLLPFAGGNPRQLIGITLICWVAFFIIFKAKRDTMSLSRWAKPHRKKKLTNLPLKKDSKTVDRALGGLELSRLLIEKKLRRGLIEKIKEKENLSENEVKALLKDRSKLNEIVKDETLIEFLVEKKEIEDVRNEVSTDKKINLTDVKKMIPNIKKDKPKIDESYRKKIADMLKRISDWEGS